MKIYKKAILVILMIISLLLVFVNNVYAVTAQQATNLSKTELEAKIKQLSDKRTSQAGYLAESEENDLYIYNTTWNAKYSYSKADLGIKLGELQNKQQRGQPLTEEEKIQLQVYTIVYGERVTQPEIEQKDFENMDNPKDPIENPNFYKPSDNGDNEQLITIGNSMIGAIRTLGTLIAVVCIMVIGLRYIAGSAEQKANYKETMMPYLIGAVMLFTIPNLLGIIYDLVKSIDF